ncbi:MAG: PD-(D/E)XK nuclease family protein [Candidatus Liptonbacteria bacterium]|nr:PD-(D/E)XK nuclease family protein [Candidatus Liptonbacteria bacterium]
MQKLSRSKIELFIECPRCFWLDVKKGVKRPPPAPYTINNAIDYLLKQEFDLHREKGTRHPVMEAHKIDAVPMKSPEINKWRHNFTGVGHHHKPTDFWVFGAVDDVWINPKEELIVVDYKATGANQHQIYDSYKRQLEIYQWLLSKNGHKVSPTGYFVFARVSKANGFGHGKAALSFDLFVEPQKGDASWVGNALRNARKTLNEEKIPAPAEGCAYCAYRANAGDALIT